MDAFALCLFAVDVDIFLLRGTLLLEEAGLHLLTTCALVEPLEDTGSAIGVVVTVGSSSLSSGFCFELLLAIHVEKFAPEAAVL